MKIIMMLINFMNIYSFFYFVTYFIYIVVKSNISKYLKNKKILFLAHNTKSFLLIINNY